MSFEVVRVADLAERLAGLEPLADVSLCGDADDLAVAVGDQGQLADLVGDLLDHRLQLLGEFLVLLGLGPVLPLGALAEPHGLDEVDVVVLLSLRAALFASRGWTAWPGRCLS